MTDATVVDGVNLDERGGALAVMAAAAEALRIVADVCDNLHDLGVSSVHYMTAHSVGAHARKLAETVMDDARILTNYVTDADGGATAGELASAVYRHAQWMEDNGVLDRSDAMDEAVCRFGEWVEGRAEVYG